jgi:Cystatin domain
MRIVSTAVAIYTIAAMHSVILAQEPVIPGGKADVSVNDSWVVEAANYAVSAKAGESGTNSKKLELIKVLKAEQQVVAGINYYLTLRVREDGKQKEAVAVVWRKLSGEHELTGWKMLEDREPNKGSERTGDPPRRGSPSTRP